MPFGDRKFDRVRIAKSQDNILAFHFRAIADAHDIEILFKAFGNTGNRIGHQSAGEPMKGAMFVRIPLGDQRAVLLFEANSAGQRHRHLALRSLDFHGRRL